MRKLLILFFIVFGLVTPVNAMEFTAPTAPDGALEYMPEDTQSFGEGLWYVVQAAIEDWLPSVSEAGGVCLSLMAIACLVSLLESFSGGTKHVIQLSGILSVGLLLLGPANSMIRLSTQTISQLSEYGKLLLPVMSGALAAQGGVGTSTALYSGTMLFSSALTGLISNLLVPLV